MNRNNIFPLQWGLLSKWIAATLLGFLIFDGASLFIPQQSFLFLFYLFAFQGLLVAILQWLFVLRLRIPSSSQWILWGTIGWAAGWLIGKLSTAIIISLLIHGIILGSIQWVFLIRKLYPKSFWWVLINTIGLPAAYGLSWFVIFPFVLGNYSGLFSGPLDSAIRGALFGAITGTTFIWLSRLPRAEIDMSISNA